ncbi:MAG: hypothetical protein KC931_17660, partial [Candidatus Omnitrophica bacterium]|nr:hypothetical protein [Candidatus Omnitrophota bacterium]
MNLEFLSHPTWGAVYPTVFIVAVLSALVVTPIVSWYSRKIGFLDIPNQRTVHAKPIPLGGGAAIAIAFVIAVHAGVFQAGLNDQALKVVLIGGLITLTLGLIDDFVGGISAVFKLLALFLLTFMLWQIDDDLILKIFPWTWL